MALPKPYPKDAEKLLREVSATTKIHDIKEYYKLKERVEVKWWESAIVFVLFIAGLGFVFTMIYLVPVENREIFFRFLAFWSGLLILALIATIEFLIAKIRALRRLHDIQTRLIEGIQNEIERRGKEEPQSESVENSE